VSFDTGQGKKVQSAADAVPEGGRGPSQRKKFDRKKKNGEREEREKDFKKNERKEDRQGTKEGLQFISCQPSKDKWTIPVREANWGNQIMEGGGEKFAQLEEPGKRDKGKCSA